ncbi:hypothetical protein ERJ75_001013600 [Trypanosoma vivax]|uniref:Fe2OG dioxygenase domain-containing protein n=1 Tax=Trypanosoma vivax (strain Y486) TaxID=1055687 RepID=G0U266_TRYVY|nr:hypothetical protein ERJ75_001013600 [Trypanosoma vivax]CCC50369.1 conserved hypothetical protein [Trypanosoma vivax Y486]
MAGKEAVDHVPAPVICVCRRLEAAAMEFARNALLQPSIPAVARHEVLRDVDLCSVFRAWRYDAGVGCRPHYDPGLCTALLMASAAGFEINHVNTDLLIDSRRYNDQHTHQEFLDALPGWTAPQPHTEADDTVVISGRMLHLLSKGTIPAVLHRVKQDWATNPEAVRYSFVVELRPANPAIWY